MDIVTNTLIMLASGVPGMVVSGVAMILMLLALIRKEPGLMIFSALLVIPFAYARGSWWAVGLFIRVLPLFSLSSAFAISKDDPIFAWSLPIPVFGYLIYILFKILSSGYGGIDPVYIY